MTDFDNRFQTSRATLIIDRLMTLVIKGGGLAVIVAVFAIFVFILLQVLPLFRSADVRPLTTIELPAAFAGGKTAAVISDEWGEHPLVIAADGQAVFADIPSGKTVAANLGLGQGASITAMRVDPRSQRVVIGTGDGRLAVRKLTWAAEFAADNKRSVTGSVSDEMTVPLGEPGKPLIAVAFGDGDEEKLVGAIQDLGDRRTISLTTFTQTRSLLGKGEITIGTKIDLSARIKGTPENLLIDERGQSAIVTTREGELFYFFLINGEAQLRQTLRPFQDLKDPSIASIDWLLGDVSLVLTAKDGANRIISLHIKPGADHRAWDTTKEFPALPGPATSFAPSIRNKAFLLASGEVASLRYGTSAAVRWEGRNGTPITAVALSGKYQRMMLAGQDGRLSCHLLDDPHPEGGMAALFGKVWYEGAEAPRFEWQSTGGSDDFEPKLSMIPLLIGSLKGTFYAMLFAFPIAILGAVYTAEFMHPKFKKVVKPVVEIMASLPSVVLGFLAAIWLAPMFEHKVPSLIAVIILVPAVAMCFGWWWARLPMRWRSLVRPGYEYLAFLPLLLSLGWLAWSSGPLLENLLVSITNKITEKEITDFRMWWREITGLSFEQRNSLVVGIMMGFAVIPIIFTITEDALSNVPTALRSGSLALGASRWQTAIRVVVPTASAGIFSALMIGFGRAIGETMIVVMATGNTPVMGMNIFDGMRTLSANIAVELPEAPQHSTLYRTLFLGALLLFALTFIINTAAEVLRQHLREKYKTV